MDVTSAFLAVSLIINLLFFVGVPGTMFVRALLRRMKTWVIGLNGPPTIRLMNVKGSRLELKEGNRSGDLEIDPTLCPVTPDGRMVIFYDRKTLHQIGPDDARDHELEDGELAVVTNGHGQVVQLKPFNGQCVNDADELVVKRQSGKLENIGPAWRRIDGWFLNAKRKSHNVEKLVGEPDTMWTVLERATPFLVIIAIVLMIGMWATIGSVAG